MLGAVNILDNGVANDNFVLLRESMYQQMWVRLLQKQYLVWNFFQMVPNGLFLYCTSPGGRGGHNKQLEEREQEKLDKQMVRNSQPDQQW